MSATSPQLSHESASLGPTYIDPFLGEIGHRVANILNTLALSAGSEPIAADKIQSLLGTPPDFSLGHAALPCFAFAKSLKKSPQDLANFIKTEWETTGKAKLSGNAAAVASDKPEAQDQSCSAVAEIQVAGGYLNFFADFSVYAEGLFLKMEGGDYENAPLLSAEKREKIVVEYSQPNTHKAMHIGHLRCLILGDALCHLLARAGHGVVRVTYPGDLGAHIAKALWLIQQKGDSQLVDLRSASVQEKADWLGKVYAEADEKLKADLGTPQEDVNRTHLKGILHQLYEEAGPAFELWKETREWSFAYMREVYAWLGCEFETWYTESECNKPSVELVKQKLKDSFFVQDQGAIGLDLSAHKLGFAMFLKSDGHGLYITKDLELLRRKFEDPKVTRSIYVVDARQKLHFQQLFKTAEMMGFPQASKSLHLSYETVNDETGNAFSSRALNTLGLAPLRADLEKTVRENYLARYEGEWSPEAIHNTARDVAIGALKYGLLKVDNNTQITFIRSEWLRLDGETGPYLQYVHARCCQILEKQKSVAVANSGVKISEQAEKELVLGLGRLPILIAKAATENRPHIVAGALFDLAKSFNRFYESCSIKDAEGEVRITRIKLVKGTAQAIRQGLTLLGIPALEKM